MSDHPFHCTVRRPGRSLGIGLLLAAGAAVWGEPAPPSPAQPGTGADRQPPPPEACYRAAREGGEDAYVCDLAVQIARDGGSPADVAAALANRALLLAGEGRLEPALADLDAALAATPDDPVLHGNRGNLLLRMGRPAEALAAHSRAVELAPQDPVNYYNRAFSLLALGEPKEAEQEVAAARALLARRRPAVTAADRSDAGADRAR
ncbi:MAG TPA: tetratricopeptide repeat protein [Pseudomonadales bacterium]